MILLSFFLKRSSVSSFNITITTTEKYFVNRGKQAALKIYIKFKEAFIYIYSKSSVFQNEI